MQSLCDSWAYCTHCWGYVLLGWTSAGCTCLGLGRTSASCWIVWPQIRHCVCGMYVCMLLLLLSSYFFEVCFFVWCLHAFKIYFSSSLANLLIPSLPHLLLYLLVSFTFFLTYLLHLFSCFSSISSHCTRIIPLFFQAGCRRRRLNLALVFCVDFMLYTNIF